MSDPTSNGQCPVMHGSQSIATVAATANHQWWPNQLNLKILHQNPPAGSPMEDDFDYAKEVATIDVEELKNEVNEVLTTSQDWWPADYGHYGPLMIRLS